MRISRSIASPSTLNQPWETRWKGPDLGLIASWERGREKRVEAPELAARARQGELVPLAWKGGVEKALKAKRKFGTLRYLAMWQGLRGDDLNIDTDEEVTLICASTGMHVTYTAEFAKWANES